MPARMPLVVVALCALFPIPDAHAQSANSLGQFGPSGGPPPGWPHPPEMAHLAPQQISYLDRGDYAPPPALPPGQFLGQTGPQIGPQIGPQPGIDHDPLPAFGEAGPPAPTVLPLDGQTLAQIYAGDAAFVAPWWSPSAWLPEVRERWDERPVNFGAIGGFFSGGVLDEDDIEMDGASFFGLRFGRDYDDRWSWEARAALAEPEITNDMGPPNRRTADLLFGDSSLVYSPRYSDRFRTFLSIGGGVALFDFTDERGRAQEEFVPTLPLGAGIRYRIDEWLVLQLDVRDTIVLGAGAVDRMHLLTVTGSAEFRFGSSAYWPWDSRRYVWYN